jgi:dihydroorotate dehydrogenase/ferredoxin
MAENYYLPVKVAGLEFKNPFYVASGPTARTVEQLLRIEKTGWAAASLKLSIDPSPYINRVPRYAVFNQYNALAFTAEKRLKFEEGLKLINDAKKVLTDLILMANITYAGENGVSGWVNMAKKFEQAGADIIELNMCCPNMSYNTQLTKGDENAIKTKTGASLGKNAGAVSEIVAAIKKAISIPLFVKLTPEGGEIAEVAKAVFYAGADVVGGTGNRLGVPPIDLENPGKAIYRLQEEISMSCFSGSWLKPLAQRDTYEIRKVCGKDVAISAAGGIRTAQDAIEMSMCGADLMGICTETLMNGYDFIGDVISDTRRWLSEHGHEGLRDVRDIIVPQFRSAPELTIYTGYARVKDPQLSSPCRAACPAGVPIQTLMKKISEGKNEEAFEELLNVGLQQELCGYLCDAPCEKACVKGRQTVYIAIQELEKFTGTMLREKGLKKNIKKASSNGKRVAIAARGVAGNACAFELLKAGYDVTIYRNEKEIFDMLPCDRLPMVVLEDVETVLTQLGAKFQASHDDLGNLASSFDAVYSPAKLVLGQCSVQGAVSTFDFLKFGKPTGKTVVIGNGFLAAEVARAAALAGHEAVVISSTGSVPSFLSKLKEEGISVIEGASDFVRNGRQILFKQNKLGLSLSIECDTVVNALEAFAPEGDVASNVFTDKSPLLSPAKLIACGKNAAAAIDHKFFDKRAAIQPVERPPVARAQDVLTHRKYNPTEKNVHIKAGKYQELYTDEQAAVEAARCLRCGCGEGCDLCHKICCEFAISLDEERKILIDPEKCVACGMCYNRCPNSNIEMFCTDKTV